MGIKRGYEKQAGDTSGGKFCLIVILLTVVLSMFFLLVLAINIIMFVFKMVRSQCLSDRCVCITLWAKH